MTRSLPNALDYQKHGLNLHKNQIDLAKNRVDLMAKQPGGYEPETGLIDDFQQMNQTRKTGWRALLDGLASGLKYSLKSAEGEKKKTTYANMEKMFSSFEEAGLKLQKQNERNGRRQEDMETKVIPSVVGYLTYLQNNPSYDEAFANLNSRFEQIKAVMSQTGLPHAGISDGELVALSPRNYEVGIFKDRKTGQLKELPVSSLLPPDLLKGRPDLNTYERAKDADKMALERQKALKARGSQTSADQARLENEETRTYLELYGLLKDKDIDPTSGVGSGIRDWIAQNVPLVGGLAGEGAANRQAYSQATSNLKGQTFRKHGYRNQADFENIHTLPDTLPREEALKFVEGELRKRGIPIPDTPAGGNLAGRIKVQEPETNKIGFLVPEEAKIAIKRGGIRVE